MIRRSRAGHVVRLAGGVALLAAGLALGAPSVSLATAPAGLAEREFLEALSRDAAQGECVLQPIPAGGTDHKELYDRAFALCQDAVRVDASSPDLRANFGCLLLLRDRYYPAASGSFSRAVNQWYLALKREAGHRAALHYLGADLTLVRAVRDFTPAELNAFESVLRDAAEQKPESPAALTALTRFYLAVKRPADALEQARKLVAQDDTAGAAMLLGIAQLKNGLEVEATETMGQALTRPVDPSSYQAALSAAVRANLRINQLAEAEGLLAKMAREETNPEAGLARLAFDLPGPELLSAEIGQGYALLGDGGNAVRFTGVEGLQWLSSERAYDANEQGFAAYKGKDHEVARRLFRDAHALIPMEPVYLSNLARTCYELGRYREAAAAYRKLAGLRPLSTRQIFELAQADLMLGDTVRAYDALWTEAMAHRDQEWLAQWTVVAAYAAHGKGTAEECWARLLGQAGDSKLRVEFAASVLVRNGLRNFSEKARTARMNYQSLKLDSLLYRALGEAFKGYYIRDRARNEVQSERREVLERILETYRLLPMKPLPPAPAVQLASRAGAELEKGRWWVAIPDYHAALEQAPYWPEGHFILGAALSVAGHYDNFWTNMDRESDADAFSAAIHLNAYLRLKPAGPLGGRAQELLSREK